MTQRTQWKASDARALYAMDSWSDGFFSVNERGHVCVRPVEGEDTELDVMEVIAAARAEGTALPALIRFQDVIRSRVHRLNRKFREAVEEAGYEGSYRGIFPIKVNQLQEVVAEVLEAGREFDIGLECGSRAELLAALPLVTDQTLLLCNGVKDRSMLRLVLDAQRLGQQVVPVIEKYTEFEHLLELAEEAGVKPALGVRIKLSTRGSGRWFESGGAHSKFGLTVPELVRLLEALEARGWHDALQLLHFHLGSQISDIQVLRSAVREITRIYADLVARGIPVQYLDVGGGLGVNYGEDASDPETAINYGLREYANVVVYAVKEICDEKQVPAPVLLSESGRALTAHHSMLVVPVLGVHRPDSPSAGRQPPGEDAPGVMGRLAAVLEEARRTDRSGMLLESCHDVSELREEVEQLGRLGYLNVTEIAAADSLYWSICRELLRRLSALALDPPPPEQVQLEELLTDLYLGNFSVFHSIIDHWAIEQVFPIMPLHRLSEEPDRRARIVDLTCDSDGKIGRYVSSHANPSWLPLHEYRAGETYYLGIFLVGAYQEILGDAHNLLGRVDEVHVYAREGEDGNFWIEERLKGITVKEMLSQVQYFPNDLDRRMSEFVRRQINAGHVRASDGMRWLNNYTRHLDDTTYCDTSSREPE
ncbi:MAG: biosynthetic arginine decarboxylase [Pseudohongiellaceae bacterium]